MSEETRIAALPLWHGRPVIEPVAAGRTNRNFIVRDRGRCYFARVGADIPVHGISRAAERRCAMLAAEAGIAPAVVFSADGIMITAYVEGETLSIASARMPHRLSRIAALLQRLHAIPAHDDLPHFCPVAAAHRYLAQLSDAELPIARRRIEAYLARLPNLPAQCLIHGDLIPENFILSGERLLLVDWEYAGNGAVATDLAMVISNFELDAATAQSLLRLYGPVDQSAVEAMRVAAIVREALWCLAQTRIGGMVGDLKNYTDLCLQRLQRVLL
jgi:thiamine kinase-like enzyme